MAFGIHNNVEFAKRVDSKVYDLHSEIENKLDVKEVTIH